jgi:transcriptional regulator with XRE-family HTH domain
MTFTLKQLIKRQGLTQRGLSKKTGISESNINGWVSQGIYPSIDNAVKLAIALEVDLKTLFHAMGIDVAGLPDDRAVSIPMDNQKSEAIAVIKSLIKSLDIDPSSLTD